MRTAEKNGVKPHSILTWFVKKKRELTVYDSSAHAVGTRHPLHVGDSRRLTLMRSEDTKT